MGVRCDGAEVGLAGVVGAALIPGGVFFALDNLGGGAVGAVLGLACMAGAVFFDFWAGREDAAVSSSSSNKKSNNLAFFLRGLSVDLTSLSN